MEGLPLFADYLLKVMFFSSFDCRWSMRPYCSVYRRLFVHRLGVTVLLVVNLLDIIKLVRKLKRLWAVTSRTRLGDLWIYPLLLSYLYVFLN